MESKRRVSDIDWDIYRAKAEIRAAEQRLVALEAEREAAKVFDIQYIADISEKQHMLRAQLKLRRDGVTFGKSKVEYQGQPEFLAGAAYFYFDEADAPAIVATLEAEGLIVKWDGDTGRAIAVFPRQMFRRERDNSYYTVGLKY